MKMLIKIKCEGVLCESIIEGTNLKWIKHIFFEKYHATTNKEWVAIKT